MGSGHCNLQYGVIPVAKAAPNPESSLKIGTLAAFDTLHPLALSVYGPEQSSARRRKRVRWADGITNEDYVDEDIKAFTRVHIPSAQQGPILVRETWAKDDYSREHIIATAHRLNSKLAQEIKQELNDFKAVNTISFPALSRD